MQSGSAPVDSHVHLLLPAVKLTPTTAILSLAQPSRSCCLRRNTCASTRVSPPLPSSGVGTGMQGGVSGEEGRHISHQEARPSECVFLMRNTDIGCHGGRCLGGAWLGGIFLSLLLLPLLGMVSLSLSLSGFCMFFVRCQGRASKLCPEDQGRHPAS